LPGPRLWTTCGCIVKYIEGFGRNWQSGIIVVDGGMMTSNETDLCHLPSDVGPCDSYTTAYFYDPLSQRCEQFEWGGCGGNANRFASVGDCEQRCIYLETVAPTIRHNQLSTVSPAAGEMFSL